MKLYFSNSKDMLKAILVAGGLLVAAMYPVSSQTNIDPDGTVNLATNADPTFNPWSPNTFAESNLLNTLIFSSLTRWDRNFKAVPDLATSWKVAADGLKWTFNLRKGVKWHDGQPFTAADVAFTFNDIALNQKLGANHSGEYAPVNRVNVVNDYTVEFILKQPYASLPSYLSYFVCILPKHKFEGVVDPWNFNQFNKEAPVGTGPFKLTRRVAGSVVELTRNETYWAGIPKVKTIIFKVIPDSNAQLAQLLAGDLDLISLANANTVDRVKSDKNLMVSAQTQNLYYWISLNQTDPRLTDVRVRQALLYALDRPAMIKSILNGYGQVATGPIAPVQKAYYNNKVAKYPYDPQKAKALLKEAGWTPGPDGVLQKDGKPFVISMPTGSYQQLVPITLLVQQYWKSIGVTAEIKTMEWNSYIQQVVVKRDYQGSVAWWFTPADPDVLPYYAAEEAGGGYNIPGYKNPLLDKLLVSGRNVTTQKDRVKIYNQAQELMANELPYLYLWYPQSLVAKNRRLNGLSNLNLTSDFQAASKWYVTR